MRLGGPVFENCDSPEEWIAALKSLGYRAAYCPVSPEASADTIRAYARAAAGADIAIAEVGAWCNPLSPDEAIRREALDKCKRSLALADAMGARCCVNIAGSRGSKWDGPCPEDLTDEAFNLIVESVRAILDAVQPMRTFYTLETMPWMYPDSTDAYLRLLRAVDRPRFAVHFDPVNLISSPQRCFCNADLIRDFIARLGPHIRSCHAKDILLQDRLTVHLDEVRPGQGVLDYPAFLSGLSDLDLDLPVMLEHLPDAEEYKAAADHLRKVASEIGVSL